MNIRTRAEEKHWAAMCKAGQHEWEYIGEFVRSPIVDCCSVYKIKCYMCARCKATAEQRFRNPYYHPKEAD